MSLLSVLLGIENFLLRIQESGVVGVKDRDKSLLLPVNQNYLLQSRLALSQDSEEDVEQSKKYFALHE